MLNCNLTEMYCVKTVNQIITGNETLTTDYYEFIVNNVW